MSELRDRIEQRLAIGRHHIPITGLRNPVDAGSIGSLGMIRNTLMTLSEGGPWRHWIDEASVDAAAAEPAPPNESADGVCRLLCTRARARSTHVDKLDDELLEQFSSRLSIKARERFGLSLPHLSDSNPAYCRHFAATVSSAYARVTEPLDHLANTTVLFIMGLPQCDAEASGRLHAWNWLVDFSRGTIAAFDPQNETYGEHYANVSSLLYTLAWIRSAGAALPGLRLLVRRHDSVHGGTILFHLARHPIDQTSRRKISTRLRNTGFQRIVPGWEVELEAWDAVWRTSRRVVDVGEIVGFADA